MQQPDRDSSSDDTDDDSNDVRMTSATWRRFADSTSSDSASSEDEIEGLDQVDSRSKRYKSPLSNEL